MKTFKNNLRRIRREKDITQEELAEISGLHQSHISHFERGKRLPNVENLLKLANALQCTVDELMR